MTTQANCPANGASMPLWKNKDFVATIAFCLIGVFALAYPIWTFSWETNKTQTVGLLPLPATEGKLTEGVKVEGLSRDAFLVLAQGENVTMAIQGEAVVYEIVYKGIVFRHWQSAGAGIYYYWQAEGGYEIRDGFLVRPLNRDNSYAFGIAGLFVAIGVLTASTGIIYGIRFRWRKRAKA